MDRPQQLEKIQKECLELFKKKNADYGDSFATYGVVGVIVRLGDKIKRCMSISKKGITLVDDESLRDTLLDLHNYAAMACMLMDEGKEDKVDDAIQETVEGVD
jgi:NTP pyrophosphatase (non-canonical NTP hydrolase)